MKTAKAQWLYDYVRMLAEEMALRDWDFDVEPFEPEDEAFADINPIYGRKYARIRVRNDFWTSTKDVQRHTIAHELIHAHFAPADRWLGTCTDHNKISETAFRAYRMSLEYGVDGMADAFAPMLPLPPDLPKKKKKKSKKVKA